MNAAAPSFPERAAAVRRGAARLCLALGWVPLHEVRLPNHRRVDILALRQDGGLVCIEVKSGLRDFQTDGKWPEYLDYADALYFAVDTDFPRAVLPDEAGLIVCHGPEAALLREAPENRLAPARRRALLLLFARLAGMRLAAATDPEGMAELAAALLVE